MTTDQSAKLNMDMILKTGGYPIPVAARLVDAKPAKLRSWIDGYGNSDAVPIIRRQLPPIGGRPVLGFLDLIEAMFIRHFNTWFSPQTIRRVAEKLRDKHDVQHPFAMDVRFRTDGKAIFLEEAQEDEIKVVNLMNDNFEMGEIIERSLFEDIFYVDDIARSWRPFKATPLVIVSPDVSLGKPVIEGAWVPTRTIFDAYFAEGSVREVAYEYGIAEDAVRQAVQFETELEGRVIH